LCGCTSQFTGSNIEKCLALAALLSIARLPIGPVIPAQGTTFRWLGVRWYGLPKPIVWTWPILRELVCLRLGVPRASFPAFVRFNVGCGCIVVLKDRWTRLMAWFSR